MINRGVLQLVLAIQMLCCRILYQDDLKNLRVRQASNCVAQRRQMGTSDWMATGKLSSVSFFPLLPL